mmetsp:Transcript_6804/g.17377  ORF Transcript_6804/g.17377 Transcript_6804/m.17377 type:complete len:85 (-) Transcript_6804:206-460(-)
MASKKLSPLVKVGMPMLGVVLVGHYALTHVLQGRIQDHDARHVNDSSRIPQEKRNRDAIDLAQELKKMEDASQGDYENKPVPGK